MANELLDFVMSLVRDPDAAARYAEDPAGAIAHANLTDVTSADVSHLIPVVAESLPMSPIPSAADPGAAHNVWASSDAVSAFDAFDDHVPYQGSDHLDAPHVVTDLDDLGHHIPSVPDATHDLHIDVPQDVFTVDDGPVVDDVHLDDWHPPVDVDHAEQVDHVDSHQHGAPGFDFFS